MDRHKFIRQLTDYMESHKQQLFCYVCYHVGSAADAEDILHDVYLRMAEGYDGSCPVGNMPGYVYRSLFNACVSNARSVRCLSLDSPEVERLISEPSACFEDEFLRVSIMLSGLPETCSEVIRLRIYGSMTFDNIAEVLGVSAATAKRRYYQGLELLRLKYDVL
ncbi:RNA polymerase sigma factor [Paramuribaculum intestinale]|uniref:RNA polymerase sigma factor n=1 Tax=Paramuribaculum intestinale TaxID=2094151 RepID=UPI0025A97B14|nr:sigma-70 family RNA polymerase sigma factor [Paramuribaculum intestinale]